MGDSGSAASRVIQSIENQIKKEIQRFFQIRKELESMYESIKATINENII